MNLTLVPPSKMLHIRKIYKTFLDYRQEIGELKALEPQKNYRHPNFPEPVSEMLAYRILAGLGCLVERMVKVGDLSLDNRPLQVKCASSDGPISFGPTTVWDKLLVLDARVIGRIKAYFIHLTSNSPEWKQINVSKTEAFENQSDKKRRPRLNITSLFSQTEEYLEYLGDYSIKKLLTETKENMKVADFFCGIGGFRLGIKEKVVYANDLDKGCQKTYSLNFEPFDLKDIHQVQTEKLPDFDLFVGGFPCVAWSLAGKRLGFEDPRGQLFFEIIRILKAKKPSVILLENVKNLLTHDEGKSIEKMISELEGCGYSVKYQVLNTATYGNLPQHRERLFMVGFRDSAMCQKFRFPPPIPLTRKVSDILESEVDSKYYYTPKVKVYDTLKESVVKKDVVYQYRRHYVRENKSGVCPTLTYNMGTGGHNVPIILDSKGIRKLTPRECFRLQGFPDSYKLPNISDSQLYRQIGNSVSVPVIERIYQCIKFVYTTN